MDIRINAIAIKIRHILDSERIEGTGGFTMVLIYFFFILYTKFLPEGVL